jgi:lysophospholipase L1-like esterase
MNGAEQIGFLIASLQESLEPQTEAFITATGITDATLITAYNRAVKDLLGQSNPGYPTENIFAESVFYLFASDGVNQTHAFQQKFNLCDPRDLDAAFRINFINDVGGNHTANGWLQSSNNYGNSFINPSTFFASNKSASGHYANDNYSINQYLLGAYDGSNAYSLAPTKGGAGNEAYFMSHFAYGSSGGLLTSGLSTSFAGVKSGARYAANDHQLIHNETQLNANTTNGGAAPNQPIFIGCLNITGSPSNFSGARYQGLYFLKNPTPSKVALANNILKSFNAAIGRALKPTVAFFGDSITVGLQASPIGNSWVNQLVADRNWIAVNHGISGSLMQNTGATASNMEDRAAAMIPIKDTNSPYLVIAYGVNDYLSTDPNCTKASFKAAYQDVINIFLTRGWTAAQLVIVTPFYSNHPLITTRMEEHRDAVLELAVTNSCLVYNAYDDMVANGGNALLADSTHPNNTGHTLIFNGINSIIT